MAQPNHSSTIRTEFKVHEVPQGVFAEYQRVSEPKSVSEYFCLKYPKHANRYGPPVLEATYYESDLKRSRPLLLNEDFFCAVLGSDKRIGHHLVYHLPEQTWYFYESRFGYYSPTSEEKVMILLSQIFIHAAKEMASKSDIAPLVLYSRDEMKLRQIIKRARAMLAVDKFFFEGEHGKRRKLGAQVYHPAQERLEKLFIKEAITPAPDSILSVNKAYEHFSTFCSNKGIQPVERKLFKTSIAEVIRQEFGLGIRNDLRDVNGRYQKGWRGIRCGLQDFHVHRYSDQSDGSVLSVITNG